MPEVTEQDVEYVAQLAQLDLSARRKTQLTQDLAKILGYIDKLNELDTRGVEPMLHVLDIVNVYREDELEASLDRDVALKNAPNSDGEYFLVPKILDQD